MEEDIEASKLDSSVFCNSSSMAMQISTPSAIMEPHQDPVKHEHTSLNPKKRVMAEMAKDAVPLSWSTSAPATARSEASNWSSSISLPAPKEKHKSTPTSVL